MHQPDSLRAVLASLVLLASSAVAQDSPQMSGPGTATPERRGVLTKTAAAFDGLTLLAPLHATSTYLVDLDGTVVHEWRSDAPPGQSVYLRENGHLLRAERVDNDTFWGGGEGGRVRELDLDGKVVWEYACSDARRRQHHDFTLLPNGHLLLIAWEMKSGEQAFEAGRDASLLAAGELWPDMLLEIELTPPSGGKVVWEWHAWDHLVQDRAPGKPNYGKVAEHPELVDVNADREPRSEEADAKEQEELRRLGYAGDAPPRAGGDRRGGDARGGRGGPERGGDWLHTNALDYEPKLDLIALSVHSLSEVWIIDHSTTTEQARSHSGGRYGRGGDLLARFGNPRVHGSGSAEDQFLFGQHHAHWIAPGRPGAGHMLVFNNGQGSPTGASSVEEFALDLGVEAVKRGLPPATRVWRYAHANIDSGHISGAQRLANGNTLICAGETGRVVEVTAQGEVAWDYLSPLRGEIAPGPRGRRPPRGPADARDAPGGPPDMPPPGDGARGPRPRRGPDAGQGHGLFRATRYAHDHPGVVAVRARPAPKFELDQGRLVLPTPIAFATASAELAPDSDAALAHVAAWLTAKRDVTKARIEVHVDLAGAEGQELSLRRSLAVARWLVERGVDCERLVAVGFGDTKPLADATTPEGRAQNVRVEVRAAELRGRAIGGAPLDGGGVSAGDPCAR